MINKKVNDVNQALTGVKSGMTLMLGGFGLCGIPENAILKLSSMDIQDLICISNISFFISSLTVFSVFFPVIILL